MKARTSLSNKLPPPHTLTGQKLLAIFAKRRLTLGSTASPAFALARLNKYKRRQVLQLYLNKNPHPWSRWDMYKKLFLPRKGKPGIGAQVFGGEEGAEQRLKFLINIAGRSGILSRTRLLDLHLSQMPKAVRQVERQLLEREKAVHAQLVQLAKKRKLKFNPSARIEELEELLKKRNAFDEKTSNQLALGFKNIQSTKPKEANHSGALNEL